MENLFDGVKEFNSNDFLEHKNLFEELGKKQNPHTLFIGCSDSRLVPNLITKTLPGELFVIRNIANIVPYFRVSQEFAATTSAIEYAIKILNVENILICGHSNCGGCNAMFFDENQFKEIPNTKKWLELSNSVKQKINEIPHIHSDHAKREWMTEQLNIVEQLKHLLTYPYIKEKFEKKELNILGWYYIIETGEIFNYNTKIKQFEKIE
ncbi:MAG: carbonic anhydrase [Ignavibacteriae bacterium]|nr:carbonic anhydrase [Ignavibacteriota bacterium]